MDLVVYSFTLSIYEHIETNDVQLLAMVTSVNVYSAPLPLCQVLHARRTREIHAVQREPK